jgi:hypothetical protein
VPAAVNLYTVRKAKDTGGDLFRAVQKQKPQYQGIWIVSPDGKVLASQHDFKSERDNEKVRETLAVLEEGLRAFGQVNARPPTAGTGVLYRGEEFLPDGSVTLALYVRAYDNGRPLPRPVQDSFPLSAREFRDFAPPALKVGTQWTVPPEVANNLGRCLSPSSDQSTMPRPNEVTTVELRGRVRAVVQNEAWIGFHGVIKASHLYEGKRNHGEAKIRGLASYNFETKRMMFISFVLEGTFRGFPPYDEPRQIAAVAQWVQKRE